MDTYKIIDMCLNCWSLCLLSLFYFSLSQLSVICSTEKAKPEVIFFSLDTSQNLDWDMLV